MSLLRDYEYMRFQTNPCMRTGLGDSIEIYGIHSEIFDLPHLLVFANRNIDPEEENSEGVTNANRAWHTTVSAARKP